MNPHRRMQQLTTTPTRPQRRQLDTNDPTPSLIHDVQTGGSSGLPTSALVVVALGLLGLAGGVGYTRMRASRSVAQ